MATILEIEEAIFGPRPPEIKPLGNSVFGTCPKCGTIVMMKEMGVHFQHYHEEKQYNG